MNIGLPVPGGNPAPIGHRTSRRTLIGLAVLSIGFAALVTPDAQLDRAERAQQARSQQASTAGTIKARALESYGKLPLAFVPNAGQTDPQVQFSAQAGGASFHFTEKKAVFSFTKKDAQRRRTDSKGVNLHLAFLGANPAARTEGERPGAGRVNFLQGHDPTNWLTNLPTYERIAYRELWPGIDMVFHGDGQRLKYEFVLRPGADAGDIRLAYRGSNGLSVDQAGNLLIRNSLGVLRDERPVSYQVIGGRRVPVASRFSVAPNRAATYGFTLGAYDRGSPLVIDPGLVYSTYLGGSGPDGGLGITVDAAGSAYVIGEAWAGFPTTVGAFDTTHNGNLDAFVTKLDPTGSTLLYSTFLGGTGEDGGSDITIDAAGDAYVTGRTASADFPTTVGAFDTSYNGGGFDAFVTKLNAAGSALLFSTYLGGSDEDLGESIVADTPGSASVTGFSESTDFPTTAGAFDTTHNGGLDAFVTKLDPIGSGLLYSTYLGGTDGDDGSGIAIDAAGSAYVTGGTRSTDFPTTAGAFDTTHNGGFEDAFVTKLNPLGTGLLYSTYVGGGGEDGGNDIALDTTGSAYVTGSTSSADFPTSVGAFDTSYAGGFDAFVTKLNPAGSALVYSTYLGGTGTGQESGLGIAIDVAGSAYVTGRTASTDFPTTVGAFDTTHNGAQDAFVTKLNPLGTGLLYSTYLGGTLDDGGLGIAIDAADSAYATGFTESTDFPTTVGAFDTTSDGSGDAFVTKLDLIPVSTVGCVATISDGGRIIAANGDKATFGGHAKVPESGTPDGQQHYRDHGPAQEMTVKSINVLAVVCSADRKQAEIFGQATVDGSGSFDYRIQVNDNGEPGKGVDKYWIQLSNGYDSGQQTLRAGNVQITVHE
jgi:hypothetical protein